MHLGAVFHEEGLYPCVFYAPPGYVIYELIIQLCRDHVLHLIGRLMGLYPFPVKGLFWLNFCVPPKFICCGPNPQWDGWYLQVGFWEIISFA